MHVRSYRYRANMQVLTTVTVSLISCMVAVV